MDGRAVRPIPKGSADATIRPAIIAKTDAPCKKKGR